MHRDSRVNINLFFRFLLRLDSLDRLASKAQIFGKSFPQKIPVIGRCSINDRPSSSSFKAKSSNQNWFSVGANASAASTTTTTTTIWRTTLVSLADIHKYWPCNLGETGLGIRCLRSSDHGVIAKESKQCVTWSKTTVRSKRGFSP